MNTSQPLGPAMQAEVAEAIRQSTMEVFETMLGISDVSVETLPPLRNNTGPRSGIFSLIGMAGAWAGTTSLVCSSDFACKISSRFLQTPFETVDDEVLDAIAEITNMIGGNVKNVLERTLGDMSLSTPTVISGQGVQVHSARVSHWIILRFSCADGNLYVHMCLAPNQEAGHTRTAPGMQVPMLPAHC